MASPPGTGKDRAAAVYFRLKQTTVCARLAGADVTSAPADKY